MTAEVPLRASPVTATVLPRSVGTLSNDGDLGLRAGDADNKAVFFPPDPVAATPRGLIRGGRPADVRIAVAGQDLISEGDTVNPVEADKDAIKRLVDEVTGPTQ